MTAADLAQYRIDEVITDREYDVILLRTRGLSQNQIALALNLSRSRVRALERQGNLRIAQHRKDAA